MIRIAFLGSDSTHTEALGRRINGPESAYTGWARVVSIWGEDPVQTADKADQLGIECVASGIKEALEDTNLAMVSDDRRRWVM